MKLLLADDDVDQLELRSLTLTKAGFEVFTAADDQHALGAASQQKPDVAVVDLRFPTEADGLRLIRALKKLDNHIRIIVLTGTDPNLVEAMPERALLEAVLTKGNASRQLIAHLMRKKLLAEGQLTLEIKVVPKSSKSEVAEVSADGAMKVKLAAIPERGKANEELVALLASYFQVRKDAIEFITGEASPRKRLRVRSI